MNSQKTIHLIGIGGIGMSGLARIYLSLGYAVQGSDLKMNEVLRGLEKAGARVLMGHDASHVNGAGTVVYSTSISRDHPERLEAARKGARLLHRAEALAEICEGKTTIAVTGTHGKTTTTALIGMILKEARRDPSIVVGGVVGAFGGNACLGGGSEIVIEADESDSSFLKFSPAIEVITNIEADHMEHFETIGRVEDAYRDFLRRLPADAEWIGCAEDARVLRLARENIRPARLYGLDPKNEFYATDIVECPQNARAVAFKMWEKGRCLGPVRLNLLGVHNVLNALGAAAVGLKLGVSFSVIAAALGKYEGAGRRFGVQYEDGRF
ncbi:MAG: hypothetical protein HYZ52_03210 [Candidatus Omnitrophica bacterium]|nr:hypothetical protein [Candidatus Omnitrophota bacterium]